MKICNHLAHARDSAGHRTNHVVLIAIVDAHIRIGWPDEDGINSSIALHSIVDISIHSVVIANWVVQEAIVNHHLRLDETGLGPP